MVNKKKNTTKKKPSINKILEEKKLDIKALNKQIDSLNEKNMKYSKSEFPWGASGRAMSINATNGKTKILTNLDKIEFQVTTLIIISILAFDLMYIFGFPAIEYPSPTVELVGLVRENKNFNLKNF